MRLDKFFTTVGLLSRRECAMACRRGEITVNGTPAKRADMAINEEADAVAFRGERVEFCRFIYLFLNKPKGYVSATEDSRLPCVTELVPKEYEKRELFPCGRLDRDTEGLLLLTDDGALTHALLSPKRGVEKVYFFTCETPLCQEAEERLSAGMTLGNGEACRPAYLTADPLRQSGRVTLTEGKYHEVKRMMAALGSPLSSLKRISFAGIPLDPNLAIGECRRATEEEIKLLRHAAGREGE